jgi:rSAM/selenodomain-associated transferase 1
MQTVKLIIFTRYPEPGKAMTRLIDALGPGGAADLHRRLTERTMAQARKVATPGVSLEVHFTGSQEQRMRDWLGEDLSYRLQPPGDLGERMAASLAAALTDGADAALLVGTDCPGLSATVLEHACAELVAHDLVIGPAVDGGYYLIGLRRPMGELFGGIPWGTNAVLTQTLCLASDLGLEVALVETLRDVDRASDLKQIAHLLGDELPPREAENAPADPWGS